MTAAEHHNDNAVLVNGFSNIGRTETTNQTAVYPLQWYCAPDSWPNDESGQREGRDGSWHVVVDRDTLVVAPPAKKDFWRKTYYSPTLVKDDGPCLFATVPDNQTVMAETMFTIASTSTKGLRQFDQAGICVRFDSEHWLKTGIEIVDGIPRLSCVCTNSYSDWSTQKYWKPTATDVRIRVHVLQSSAARSIVVEAWEEAASEWQFIRICHLSVQAIVHPDPLVNEGAWSGRAAPPGNVYVGIFAACPEDQTGAIVTFHEFTIVEGSTFQHDADGNHEK